MAFHLKINEQLELEAIDGWHGPELFQLIDTNRNYLRRWLPWVEVIRAAGDMHRAITLWKQQDASNNGFYAGIWHEKKLCGVINHLLVDRGNRWTALSYWLAASHQGKGIMTASCRAMIRHSFTALDLHRVAIECATENARSRAIPERLGFKLDGVIRGCEWLHDHFADHAFYSLLRDDEAAVRLLESSETI